MTSHNMFQKVGYFSNKINFHQVEFFFVWCQVHCDACRSRESLNSSSGFCFTKRQAQLTHENTESKNMRPKSAGMKSCPSGSSNCGSMVSSEVPIIKIHCYDNLYSNYCFKGKILLQFKVNVKILRVECTSVLDSCEKHLFQIIHPGGHFFDY